MAASAARTRNPACCMQEHQTADTAESGAAKSVRPGTRGLGKVASAEVMRPPRPLLTRADTALSMCWRCLSGMAAHAGCCMIWLYLFISSFRNWCGARNQMYGHLTKFLIDQAHAILRASYAGSGRRKAPCWRKENCGARRGWPFSAHPSSTAPQAVVTMLSHILFIGKALC